MSEKKRLLWLDIVKGICIFFVMLSHSYPNAATRSFFTPFFLNMFFVTAGYTFSIKSSFKEFIIGKIKGLVVPLLILGTVRLLLLWAFGGFSGNIVKNFLEFLLQINCKNDEMWFISCLFTCELIFYFIVRFISVRIPRWIVCFVFMALGFADILLVGLKLPWELELACIMMPYINAGLEFKNNNASDITEKKWIPFVIASSVIYIASTCIYISTTDVHNESFDCFPLFIVSSFAAILPLFFIAQKLENTKFGKVLNFLGLHTLFYYAFSGIVREFFYIGIKMVGLSAESGVMSFVLPITCAVFMAVIMAPFAYISMKWFPWAFGKWPKKKK